MPADENSVLAPDLTFGEFRLDYKLRRLYRGTEPVKLTPKPFSTLQFLINNRERVVSKEELLRDVWRVNSGRNAVEQAVEKLRKALGDDVSRPQYIETIPGQGYHFIATVLTQDTPAEENTVSEHATLTARAVRPLAETLEETSALDTRGAANRDHMPMAPSARIRWRFAAILVGSLAVVIAALFVFRPGRVANPQRATVVGMKLTAFDDAGHPIWRYQFPGPLLPIATSSNFDLAQNSQTYVQDLNGDGKNEVLVAASHGVKDESSDELYCFAANGRLLWHYQPQADFSFVGRKASGPWKLRAMTIVPEVSNARAVWAAFSDAMFAPAFVVSVDAVGHAQIRYVSSGNVNDITNVVNEQGTFILAGGINNEYRAASLAVIDSHQPPAASPQTPGNRFQCLNCPSGGPLRYVLLPRSEVNVGSSMPYNWVTSLYRRGGSIAVSVLEQAAMADGPSATEQIEFSGDLVPKNISFGAGYKEIHERLEKLGKIDHTWVDCEEQKHPAIARIWDSHGWREIQIPWVR
jgi:DNA-binding winged helix-turn-helix (wHTH) protein